MPTKLKGLKITSTDLVDQGANPDAHIRLFKRKDDEPTDDGGEKQTFFRKFAAALENAYRQCAPNTMFEGQPTEAAQGRAAQKGCSPNTVDIEKDAQTFTDYLSAELMRDLTREAYGYCDALMDSLRSIIVDCGKSSESKLTMMNQSVDQFTVAVKAAIPKWANGISANAENKVVKDKTAPQMAAPNGVNKSAADNIGNSAKEETDNMKFDKSKMTPEEIQTLESLEKRYGIADEPAPAEPPADDVNKSAAPTEPAPAEMHPDVKKALEDLEAVKKANLAEIEELKKSLEMERLTSIAKKYEIIGKKTDELAAKLYELKKTGGTVYADYIALLDENVNTVEKGGLFKAIGSDNSGSSDAIGKISAAAGEIAKSANTGVTPETIVKAWESNPELAAAYEAEYKNGGK